ncbi:MAG: hypothetical protein QG591_1976 [Planctomycetota bacterium]|nr:hypothetical protein [Planctomycetota bacterium]MDQ1284532.1 hypothetical protein [Patescibacteria group bacterium]
MKIVKLCSGEISRSLMVKCAELYCDIWKESPWEEYFWTVPDVLRDMEGEFSKMFANSLFAVDETAEILGFTWGYAVSAEELQEICGSNELGYIFDGKERVFYIDELGVKACRRISGVGEALSRGLINWAVDCGLQRILLRTDEKAAAARKLYGKIGFQELTVKDEKHPERTYWVLEIAVPL